MRLNTAQQVRVGVFVTLGLLFSMLVIFLLGEGLGLFQRKYELNIRSKDISGLRIDAPVFLAGIQIGKVEGIRFPASLDQREVVVNLLLHREYQDRIRQDSQASISTQGLLGDKAIAITVGTLASKKLEEGEYITVKEMVALETLAQSGVDLIDNFKKITQEIKEGKGLAHSVIYDPDGKKIVGNLSKMTQSAQEIFNRIQGGDNALHALIYEPEYERNVSQSISNLKKTTENLEAITAKVVNGEGSVGGLINDPTVYYDLMTLLGKANRNKLLRTVIRATLVTNEKDLME
jgi:phospholipid/cholesterol/gamma-HCH transport system substrate-binding protein